ncbi:MAG: hypothetical protein NVS3B27_21440 [Novosphingobium sp.]
MSGQVVVITGGVGGSKLVLALMKAIPPEGIVAIVNTADDFEHFPVIPAAVAAHYRGVIDAMLVDERDASGDLAAMHLTSDTLMTTLADRRRVTETALELARRVVR